MATIKLKRGTSAPTTSDIADGEVAIDKSAQKLYLRDGSTIKEIGGSTTGTTLDLSGALTGTTATFTTADNLSQVRLVSTDADASAGPRLDLFRNSASPAASDFTGRIRFLGEDSAGNETGYAHIDSIISDTTDGSEDGHLRIETKTNGTMQNRIGINSSETVFNEDSISVDFRVESDGQTNMFFVDAGTNRVGINTNTPDTVFEIRDADPVLTIRDTETSSASGNATLRLAETGSSDTLNNYWDIKADGGKLQFIDNWNEGGGTGTRVTLGDAGYVGIGTTAPTAHLDVTGNTGIYVRDSGGGGIVLDDSDTADGSTPMVWMRSTAGTLRLGYANRNSSTGRSTGSTNTVQISPTGIVDFTNHIDLPDSKYVRLGNDADMILYHDGSSSYIQSQKQDADIFIRGNDGGTSINALQIDFSANGAATFSANVKVGKQLLGGFNSVTTSGTLDWNDVTNARSGMGYSLLQGGDTNGPELGDSLASSGGGAYYYITNWEYSSTDGGGNLTQVAIPYLFTGASGKSALSMRSRYSGTWTGWYRYIHLNVDAGTCAIDGAVTADNYLTSGYLALSAPSTANNYALVDINDSTFDFQLRQYNGSSWVTSLTIDQVHQLASFLGNVEVGQAANISMDSSASGQLIVDGSGYHGAIALDATAMHVYHNSSSRNLVLGTNETAALTIAGSNQDITLAGSLKVPDNKYLRVGNGNDLILYHNGTASYIQSQLQDADIHIRGNDGGTNFNALSFDMSNNGAASFNSTVSAPGINVSHTTDNGVNIVANDTTGNSAFSAMRIDYNASGSDTLTGDRMHAALEFDVDSSATGGNTSEEHRLYSIYSHTRATGDSDLIYGAYFNAEAQHSSGQVSAVYGVYGRAEGDATGGTISQTIGVLGASVVGNEAGVTHSNAYGGYFKTTVTAANADTTVGNLYGGYFEVEIDPPGAADVDVAAIYGVHSVIDNDGASSGNPSYDLSDTPSYLYYGNYTGTLPGNAYGLYILDDVTNYLRGSLGIGTTNPTRTLMISSDDDLTSFTGTSYGAMYIRNSDYASGEYTAIDFGYNGTQNPVGRIGLEVTASGSRLSFGTSNSYASGITNQPLTINYNGCVGINTTTAAYTLDVDSTIHIGNDGGSGYTHSRLIFDSNGNGRGIGNFYHNQNTDLEWFAGNPYNDSDSFSITRQSTASHAESTANYALALFTIDGPTGNVGIGTTAPGNLLEVAGASPIIEINSTSGVPELQFSDGGTDEYSIMYDTGANALKFVEGGVGTKFSIADGGAATFYNSLTANGAINSFVGTYKNLRTLALATDNFSNEGVGISFSRTSSDSALMAVGVLDTDKLSLLSRNGIIFATGGGSLYSQTSEVMRIDSSGNMGLGSGAISLTTPDVAFVIGSASYTNPTIQIRSGVNGTGRLWFGDNSGGSTGRHDGYIQYAQTDQYMQFGTAGGERMRLTNGGSLLVGTNTQVYPSTDLNVGSTSDSVNGLQVQTSTSGNGYVLFGDGTGSNAYRGQLHYHHGSDYLRMVAAGGERLRCDSGGVDITGALVTSGDIYYQTSLRVGTELVSEAQGTVGPGWMSVATNTSGRRVGEIIVTDADSGDHGYIRIDWMRSYADSNFTVLNCGGHSNRITGVRVISQDSNNTYGVKILQVYVTHSSDYEVTLYHPHGISDYTAHTIVTPVIENTKSGYSLHGGQIEDLDDFSLASEEGIQAPQMRTSEIHANDVVNNHINLMPAGSDGDVRLNYGSSGSTLKLATGSGGVTVFGSLNEVSDESFKVDVQPIQNALATVTALKGVTYSEKETGNKQIGFIAQDIEKDAPDLAQRIVQEADPETKLLGLNYSHLTSVLAEAIKEQQVQIEQLTAEIKALKEK